MTTCPCCDPVYVPPCSWCGVQADEELSECDCGGAYTGGIPARDIARKLEEVLVLLADLESRQHNDTMKDRARMAGLATGSAIDWLIG